MHFSHPVNCIQLAPTIDSTWVKIELKISTMTPQKYWRTKVKKKGIEEKYQQWITLKSAARVSLKHSCLPARPVIAVLHFRLGLSSWKRNLNFSWYWGDLLRDQGKTKKLIFSSRGEWKQRLLNWLSCRSPRGLTSSRSKIKTRNGFGLEGVPWPPMLWKGPLMPPLCSPWCAAT